MAELRQDEYLTLLSIKKFGEKASAQQVAIRSGLSNAAVMRSALSLQQKNLVRIVEKKESLIRLNSEGIFHAENGLPERRLLNALNKLEKDTAIDRAIGEAELKKKFVPIALGWLQRKKWAEIDGKTNRLKALQEPGEGRDEELLKLLNLEGEKKVEELTSELQTAARTLKRRKLLHVETRTKRLIELTAEGTKLAEKRRRPTAELTQLTPKQIIDGNWRKLKLRKYNIKAPVGKIWPGKKHPYMQFLDEAKEKLVTLGFKQMVGSAVETSFFNFDALYTPQDHPAREIFGIYFVRQPKYGKLESYREILERVRETHQDGWKTGSTGWKYSYSDKEAERLILRGHGTCLSIRTLLNKDLEIPGKYFSVARCYRPEVVDRTHLTEFNQVEGIVIDQDLTLRDLLGVLEKFAIEIAEADQVRFKPDYFPFTEPSVELSAYKKGYGWIEFGGSGVFRPEVTMPLSIEAPVIAWGLGLDRLFMMRAEIDDIRHIFTQDLSWIRKKAVI